jgi:hypothetical protein
MQAERRRRREPIGQDREGLPARRTDSTSHPNAFVPVIVGMAEPLSMTDDRVVLTNRTSPRQEVQWGHPGSMLSLSSGSAIKRITPGVKARRDRSLLKFRSAGRAFHPPIKSVSNEKRILLSVGEREPLTQDIGRYKSPSRHLLAPETAPRLAHPARPRATVAKTGELRTAGSLAALAGTTPRGTSVPQHGPCKPSFSSSVRGRRSSSRKLASVSSRLKKLYSLAPPIVGREALGVVGGVVVQKISVCVDLFDQNRLDA